MYKILILFVTIAIYANGSYSQTLSPEVIASAGGIDKGTNITLCWTLGEPVSETLQASGLNIILTQGFWQPELKGTTGIDNLSDLSQLIDLHIFPNPTASTLFLEGQPKAPLEVELFLVNVGGQQCFKKKVILIQGSPIPIALDGLPTGMYVLYVLTSDRTQMDSFQVLYQPE